MKITRNKYGVSSPERRRWNGRTYASLAEMRYAQLLHHRLGVDIVEIVEQPSLWLGVPENTYRPDFLVIPCHDSTPYMPHYVDVKGQETTAFKRIKKLWASYGRLDLHIVAANGQRFQTVEVIEGGASA